MKVDEETVVVAGEIKTSAAELWLALTDPGIMRQWFFDNIPEFKPEVGFKTEFMVDAGARQFLHQWEVTEVEPYEKLAYRWTFAGYPGASLSVFGLTDHGNTCSLNISIPVEEDFPDDIPEFTRQSCLAGWQYMLAQIQGYFADQGERQ